jgi:hypothetical protein
VISEKRQPSEWSLCRPHFATRQATSGVVVLHDANRASMVWHFFVPPRRRLLSQVCLLFLALALGVIPLTGVEGPTQVVLIPLRTTFVPFDASVGTPRLPALRVSATSRLTKRVSLYPHSVSYIAAPDSGVFSLVRANDQRYQTFLASVSGRSPPLV